MAIAVVKNSPITDLTATVLAEDAEKRLLAPKSQGLVASASYPVRALFTFPPISAHVIPMSE